MKVPFQLGETRIHAVVHQNGAPVPTLLNVHDDEDTSVEAGKRNLEHHPGRLIELCHTDERLITFTLNGRKYCCDPNRIFSDPGIIATLHRHGVYSVEAHAEIKSFAARYVTQFALDREPAIIALHNVTDGIFSAESFLPGASLAAEAAVTFVSPWRSKFDFYYVTDAGFFDYLRQRDFNVILQDNQRVTEDGSLSVYFARRGIPYVNIEAAMNHLRGQTEMVAVALEMLAEFGLAK